MAISYDNSSKSDYAVSSWRTYAHTIAGTNKLLIVWVWNDSTWDKITWITYNGVSLTRINWWATWDQYTSMWYLINPADWANNIVISSSVSCWIKSMAGSYNWVIQSSPIDTSVFEAIDTSVVATTTKSITVWVDNCWVIGGIHQNWNVISINSGATNRISGAWPYNMFVDSNSSLSTGSYSMSFNAATHAGWLTTYNLVSIKPYISSKFIPRIIIS